MNEKEVLMLDQSSASLNFLFLLVLNRDKTITISLDRMKTAQFCQGSQ
jgi:hypothetical protein